MDTNEKASVLIVDDEEMVITSVRAYLQLETEYEIHGFTDLSNRDRTVEIRSVQR